MRTRGNGVVLRQRRFVSLLSIWSSLSSPSSSASTSSSPSSWPQNPRYLSLVRSPWNDIQSLASVLSLGQRSQLLSGLLSFLTSTKKIFSGPSRRPLYLLWAFYVGNLGLSKLSTKKQAQQCTTTITTSYTHLFQICHGRRSKCWQTHARRPNSLHQWRRCRKVVIFVSNIIMIVIIVIVTIFVAVSIVISTISWYILTINKIMTLAPWDHVIQQYDNMDNDNLIILSWSSIWSWPGRRETMWSNWCETVEKQSNLPSASLPLIM